MNGFINFYKPSGMSSAYALSKIKRRFKGEKIGHMGTLDPMASGVLPVAIGKATRLFDFLLDKTKLYRAEFTFGYETDTLDADGEVIKTDGKIPNFDKVLKASQELVGEILQVPPIYSAKNVNGKRSYELAREGKVVELPPKKVEILSIKPTQTEKKQTFIFDIECKGGTYIRSIARDIATKLGTFATMTSLIRLKSGYFDIENAYLIDDIVNSSELSSMLIKPDALLSYESLLLDDKKADDLINGRPCCIEMNDGYYKVYDKSCFIGVGIILNKNLKIKAYLKDWYGYFGI